MLRGVLSGSPASAPVFVFDVTTDIKPSGYLAVRYNIGAGSSAGSTRVQIGGAEMTAWRGRIMVFAYKHPDEEERFSLEHSDSPVSGGRIAPRYEYGLVRGDDDDFTVLAKALSARETRIYFDFHLFSRGSSFYATQAVLVLTVAGKRDLQVWFDRVLEQRQG